MKIGIVTQPLSSNYGGVLQNYALQLTLKRMGHTPYTLHYGKGRIIDWINLWIIYFIKQIILHPKRYNKPLGFKQFINKCDCPNVSDFVNRNINVTHHLGSYVDYNQLKEYNFEAYIVGSDQTWRPIYNKGRLLNDMFLKFAKKESNIKRISYAASFGIDEWEFSNRQTKQCRDLIHKFNAVSVREASGVVMCEKYFNVEASHILDPTFLLSVDDYRTLINHSDESTPDGDVLVYMLDLTAEKKSIVDNFCRKNNFKPFYVGVKNEEGILPSIESWLKGFDIAKYVITDSFHGTVFSIIFNIPFVSVANNRRGLSRFHSLLSIFNLEDRLVTPESEVNEISTPDWGVINQIKKDWQEKSINYLIENLK